MNRDEGESRLRAVHLVLCKLGGEVDVGEAVAVEDEHPLVEDTRVRREPQRPGRAERLVLDDVSEAHAGIDVAENALYVVRAVAAREQHVVDAVAAQPVEHEAEEGATGQWDDRLRQREREWPQAGALSARQHQGLHGAWPTCRRPRT